MNNKGLDIFKRLQRLQGGTEYLEPGTLPPEKKLWGQKELAGLYDPGPGAPVDPEEQERERDQLVQANEDADWEKTLQRRRETAYKTMGVEINGEEVEIPIWDEEMTPEQAEGFARDRLELGLSPFASDMELEAAQKANAERLDAERNAKRLTPELYPEQSYEPGTNDVPHLAGGTGDFTPYQQSLIDRMNRGDYQYTFGPGSPGATREDFQTYVGGRYSPAGGFAREGGYALAPKDYYSFTRQQRRALGIMDIAPTNQAGQLERYYGGRGSRGGDRGGRGGRGGGGGGQGGGRIPGGPFQGWTSQDVNQWHSGTPPSQMGYPSFTGTTAGPGGQNLAYETTSYNMPGYGWVPRAQLANAQASNNPLDYLNPFGGTTKGGSGTGVPTQKAVGTTVGTLSNLLLPGSGFITGPLARWATNMLQHGFSPQQVKQAVAQKQRESGGTATTGSPEDVTGAPSAPPPQGGGFDPSGRAATGREWWSQDFGRGIGGGANAPGGYNLAGPGGGFGTRGLGFSGHTVQNFGTAIGFDQLGRGGGPASVGRFMGQAGLNRPFSAERYAQLGNNLSNKGYGTWNNQAVTMPSYQQYLQGWSAPQGPYGQMGGGGKGTPFKQQFAQGDEDVMSLHRGNYPVTEEDVKDLPDWLAKMLRNIPLKPPGGNEREQFRPQSVPVMQGPHGKYYDPRYSREDERIMAAEGTSDVNPGLKFYHKKMLKRKKL